MVTQPAMELIFKQPIDKAPCICVLFESDYLGGRYQKQIIDQFQKYPFTIQFEFEAEKLNMILKTRDYDFKWKYEDLKCSPERFYKFLYDTKNSKAFSFCHIATKNNKHEVLKTPVNMLLWVVKVTSVELLQEY